MDISLGIVFGVIAMIGWGTADFFAAKAVRTTTVFKTFFWSQIIGVVLSILIFSAFLKFSSVSFYIIGIVLITGFLGVISYLAFYKGLQVGKVSIISPVAACWAVVTVILSLIFLQETLNVFQIIGVILTIIGAALTSFKLHDLMKLKLRNLITGIEYAILALLGWGIYFVFIDVLVAELSWFLTILFIKSVTVFYLLAYSGAAKKDISFPKNAILLITLIGVLEVIALSCYVIGVTFEHTAIVAPISAAFPMVTIILARIYFKEILYINQKIGIVSIVIGLVSLSI